VSHTSYPEYTSWRAIKRAGFGEALAELQQAVKGKPGAPVGNQNASKGNNAARCAALNDKSI
jgi:hypothetical protein